jgi:hypothetical protein
VGADVVAPVVAVIKHPSLENMLDRSALKDVNFFPVPRIPG